MEVHHLGGAAGNTYKSEFGFKNVGTREAVTGVGGRGARGTVAPTISDVQKYLDSGKFDNTGTSAAGKKFVVDKIVRDMNGRGFEAIKSEDGLKILLNGSQANVVTVGRSKDRWVAKSTNSVGAVKRGGMKGVLDETTGRRRN